MIIERQEDVTPAVLSELERAPNARFKEVMRAFITHMHDFVRQSKLTEEEFRTEAKLQPGDAETAYRLGSACLETGKANEAVRELIKTKMLAGKDPSSGGSVMKHPVYVTVTGILFYDVTTLLKDPVGLQLAVEAMIAPNRDTGIELIVGIESRGFR